MAAPTIDHAILENAVSPAAVTTREGSMTAHTLSEQIRAAEYLKQVAGKQKNHCGMVFRTLVPGGCG